VMPIFHRLCCLLPGAAFYEETPQRLTASDQTVMVVEETIERLGSEAGLFAEAFEFRLCAGI